MKRIYIYHNRNEIIYFSTMKKMHGFLINQLKPVHKTYATFERWLLHDFNYTIGPDVNQEFCTISKVL